jgi:hypothetical protein
LNKPTQAELETKPGLGWNGGLSIEVILQHGLVYGIQFSENNFTVAKRQLLVNEDVKF